MAGPEGIVCAGAGWERVANAAAQRRGIVFQVLIVEALFQAGLQCVVPLARLIFHGLIGVTFLVADRSVLSGYS